MNLLATETFPTHNICYLLFLDIVEWFSCNSTTHMRYREETLQFWRIGYRLFHGKFIRFMSGMRSFDQVLDGTSDKGFFDPLKSKVNFAVPSRNNLYKETSSFYPGINEDAIKATVSLYKQKPLKLSADGKKISRGKCKNIGDIDCWGYEATPNLSERKKSHTEDISNIESVQNKIDEMEGIVRDLNELSSEDKYAMKDVLRKTIQCLGLK